MECPCGSGETHDRCCGPYLRGEASPPTAEALMRSRYTAYTLGEVGYVVASHDPRTRHRTDEESAREWADGSEWLGLTVLDTVAGGPDDEMGEVEFIARYRTGDQELSHHERSTFRRRGGRWFFHDGRVIGNPSVVRDKPKVGRNDPCPCGSGLKHKKCCGRPGKQAT